MKILVIGNVRPGHKALVELGHEIVVLMHQEHSHAPDVKFPYTSLVLMNNQANAEEYAAIAQALHQFHQFERVACFNDIYQAYAVQVAEHLSLPYPHSLVMVNTLNDKYQTRQKLAINQLDDTHCQLIQSMDELIAFSETDPRPFMIKPLDSNASSGVSKVTHVDAISNAVEKLKLSGHNFPIIAETFLVGPEFSVEAMSEGGEHVIIGITQKIKDDDTFIELGHIFPASLNDEIKIKINSFVCNVLTTLGVTDGPSHTEIILTSDGPRIVETHSRAGGDNIFRLIELATGINIYQYEARQLAGESVLACLHTNKTPKCAAAVLFIGLGFDEHTHLVSVDNLEASLQLEHVDQVILIKQTGDKLLPMKSSRDRAALAIATGITGDEAMATCQQALNKLKFNLTREYS
jgi:biotin carboxylase